MTGNLWKGGGQPRNGIFIGVLGEEHPKNPGTYRFSTTEGYVFPDAHILSPDGDNFGNGQFSRAVSGSVAVGVTSNDGAHCAIVGFMKPPSFDETKDDPPTVGHPDDNGTSQDKVFKTEGGATLILKRGGAIIIEGGGGTGIILNPLNNTMSLRATNATHIADGYKATRGRAEVGSTQPWTIHQEDFLHMVGPKHDRFRISHGDLGGLAPAIRRELLLESVIVARSKEVAIKKTRERYYSDGSWVGEGKKYQWGGTLADEPFVLGNALVDALSEFIDIIKNLKVNTAWGPSTVPLPITQLDLESLKKRLFLILSTFMYSSRFPAALV